MQLADTFVQLQQPLLVLATELLWRRLLWVFEDFFHLFQPIPEIRIPNA